MPGLRTPSQSTYRCKAEVNDKSMAVAPLILPARENIQHQAGLPGASEVDTVLPHWGTNVESPAKFNEAIPVATCSVNSIDYTRFTNRASVNADFRSDVKPTDADILAVTDSCLLYTSDAADE